MVIVPGRGFFLVGCLMLIVLVVLAFVAFALWVENRQRSGPGA